MSLLKKYHYRPHSVSQRLGDTHCHPIIVPLVICPFLRGTHLHPIILVPSPFLEVPHPSQVCGQDKGRGTPWYPPRPGLDGIPPGEEQERSTWYSVGGMPFAFMQEDCLVIFSQEKKTDAFCCSWSKAASEAECGTYCYGNNNDNNNIYSNLWWLYTTSHIYSLHQLLVLYFYNNNKEIPVIPES